MMDTERKLDLVTELLQRSAELPECDRGAARAAFLQRVDRERQRPNTLAVCLRYAAPLAVAAGLVLLFLALRTPADAPRLDYVVKGAVSEGGYVRAAADRPAEITFSDRTRIDAAAGTRLRIDEAASTSSARVSVERGRLEATVIHADHRDWRFVAGPFQVRVTGTRFTLGWDAEQERLEVVLHEGSVEVAGAGSGAVNVRAGQRFVGDARRKTMLVSETDAPHETSEQQAIGGDPVPDALPQEPVEAEPVPRTPLPTPAASPKVTWSALVTRGDFGRVVAEAAARGTRDCFASCSIADLTALADAARYVGRSELAEPALLALRRRDARGSGSRATYLLGRLYEGRGNLVLAKKWYETSLREAPSGAFASESLAGKMRAVKAVEGRVAASPLAREYLRRYPTGVHAATARRIADGP